MDQRLRLGLVGSGSQGRYLSEAARLTSEFELVACADIKPEAAAEAAARCGYTTAYADVQRMLAQEELDAVIVATIHDQLQPCGMAVVEAGKHLFIEKPMALTAAGGRELVAAAKSAGVKVMVGYTLPFLAERARMKQLVAEGAVGDIVHITAGQLIGRMGGWLADPAHGGGPLLYVGTHVIYQVLDLIEADIERVQAEVEVTDTGVDAACLFSVRFANGVVAQITTSQRMGGRYGWIDVIGSAGRIRSEWESPALTVQSQAITAYRDLTTIQVPSTATGPAIPAAETASVASFSYIRAWTAEFAEFAAAIHDAREPCVNGDDGVRVLEITDAVIASGRTPGPAEPGEPDGSLAKCENRGRAGR